LHLHQIEQEQFYSYYFEKKLVIKISLERIKVLLKASYNLLMIKIELRINKLYKTIKVIKWCKIEQ